MQIERCKMQHRLAVHALAAHVSVLLLLLAVGVSQAFAIQAGREVRVMASSKDTDDEKMAMGGLVRDTQTPPLEHRFHVMSLDAAGGDEGEETPKPTPKKKARTPAELIKQRREMGK